MRKLCITLIGIISVLLFTTCQQYTPSLEEYLSYWSAEVTATDYRIDTPYQTNGGVQCVPSVNDARVTVKLRNPKNITMVTPASSADAEKVIRFPKLSVQPEYGTDYTLTQTASDTFTLEYKSAFLKKYEWNTGNIGPEITLISKDGREFSQRFNTHIEVNTPPKLSYVTIGKTRTPDATGKRYYVIILKAEDMSVTAGASSELLHKDITALSVTGRDSENISFTAGHTAFAANGRLLATGDVTGLTAGDITGPVPPPVWNATVVSDPWALRYRTDTEVATAAAVYTFRLADEKGLSSDAVSVSTSETQAQDVQLFDGTTEIFAGADSSTPPASMHTINTESNVANVTVKAKTATAGAIITGRVEKYNGSDWEQVGALINSGAQYEYDIDLPAPGSNRELAYKITLTAGGIGFSPGNEKVFYVKVKSTVTIDNSEGGAWKRLKAAVAAAQDGDTIKISGTITATGGDNSGKIDITQNITIERAVGASTAVLNANRNSLGSNAHPIFRVSDGKTLTLKNLTLKGGKGKSGSIGGGAITVTGGGSKAELTDCTIEDCEAEHGGAIGCGKNTTVNLTNTTVQNCTAHTPANSGQGGAICAEGATVNITNCTLKGNEAQKNGGAIYALRDSSIISNVIISGGTIGGTNAADANKATGTGANEGMGGGIYVGSGCTLTMQNNVQLTGNTSAKSGGAICALGATVNITNCTLKGNEAKLGGAIYAQKNGSTPSTVTVTGGTIGGTGANDANKATGSSGEGGGIYAGENCTVTLQNNVRVIGNKATGSDGRGGGIYAEKATVNMTNCTFESNTATKGGGGVYASSATVNMTNCTLSGNKADNNIDDGTSGGIYTYQGNLTMTDCTLTGNTARLNGGGVRAESTPVTMTNCTFTGNKARCGGAICASNGGADVTIEGGTIGGTGVNDANKVTDSSQSSGGGIHIEGGATVTLKGNVKVIGNKAPGSAEGAGVYVNCYSTLQMQESAQVDTNNDVFLQKYDTYAAKIKVTGALTPPGGTAARITVADNQYNTGRKVLDGISALLNSEHGKFSVTPKGSQYWVVKNDGYLSNTTTDIFATISKNQIHDARYSMSANIINNRKMNLPNKLIFYKTNEGNYGIMHVTEVDNATDSGKGHIKINYKTFNSDGSIKKSETGKKVVGTFYFDLDNGASSEGGSDFQLKNHNNTDAGKSFDPKNNALFYVLP